jgi:monothiol glutaredoxin
MEGKIMNARIRAQIESDIKNNKVMLYMKGSPNAPQCGFSAQTVSIIKEYKVPFHSINVLEDEEIRQGIKEFSDWPTIPQLYINGEFIGGCDIVTEMHQSGELAELMKSVK